MFYMDQKRRYDEAFDVGRREVQCSHKVLIPEDRISGTEQPCEATVEAIPSSKET
jgi:hypothetical protein